MRLEAAAVLILLLAPAALGQGGESPRWTQLDGDPAHSKMVLLPDTPLDVIGSGRLTEAGAVFTNLASFAVEADGELLALTGPSLQDVANALCSVVRLDVRAPLGGVLPTLTPQTSAAEPCPDGARLVGIAPEAGLAFYCWDGNVESVELRAVDLRTEERRWTANLPPDPTLLGGAADQNDWACSGVVEDDKIVLAFANNVQHVIIAFDFDGQILWRTRVPATRLFAGPLGTGIPDPTAPLSFNQVTRGQDGYFVWNQLGHTALAWLDEEGRPVEGYLAGEDDLPSDAGYADRLNAQDVMPVAQGDAAIAVMGGSIVLVRSSDVSPVLVPFTEATGGESAIWWREWYAVPTFRGLLIMRTPDFVEQWTWKAPAPDMLSIVVTTKGEVLALARTGSSQPAGYEYVLSWVDLSTRTETRRLPLGFIPVTDDPEEGGCAATIACDAQIIGLQAGGLAVLVRNGDLILLGRADPAIVPDVGISSAYPPLGDAFEIRFERPSGAKSMHVVWGDGQFDEVEGDRAQHAYTAEGRFTPMLTVVYGDNRTATRAMSIDVGGTPPVQLTTVQRAFSPENQNFTFFLLGLAFTGGGVLFAALLRRQRHTRLAEEERKLRAVIDASLLDPTKGLAALESHRAHLKDQHTRRRLDDAQYGLLDQRCVRAMKSARYRLLGSALNKLSPHFRRLLDTALEDGQVTTGEMAALVSALEEESALSQAERDRLRALLASWAR